MIKSIIYDSMFEDFLQGLDRILIMEKYKNHDIDIYELDELCKKVEEDVKSWTDRPERLDRDKYIEKVFKSMCTDIRKGKSMVDLYVKYKDKGIEDQKLKELCTLARIGIQAGQDKKETTREKENRKVKLSQYLDVDYDVDLKKELRIVERRIGNDKVMEELYPVVTDKCKFGCSAPVYELDLCEDHAFYVKYVLPLSIGKKRDMWMRLNHGLMFNREDTDFRSTRRPDGRISFPTEMYKDLSYGTLFEIIGYDIEDGVPTKEIILRYVGIYEVTEEIILDILNTHLMEEIQRRGIKPEDIVKLNIEDIVKALNK